MLVGFGVFPYLTDRKFEIFPNRSVDETDRSTSIRLISIDWIGFSTIDVHPYNLLILKSECYRDI